MPDGQAPVSRRGRGADRGGRETLMLINRQFVPKWTDLESTRGRRTGVRIGFRAPHRDGARLGGRGLPRRRGGHPFKPPGTLHRVEEPESKRRSIPRHLRFRSRPRSAEKEKKGEARGKAAFAGRFAFYTVATAAGGGRPFPLSGGAPAVEDVPHRPGEGARPVRLLEEGCGPAVNLLAEGLVTP